MLATLLTTAFLSQAPDPPDPLPDRWLLKLAPAGLPELPAPFWKETWVDSFAPRGGGGWDQWSTFKPGAGQGTAKATIVRADGRRERVVSGRTVPLAVHGSLVEFDQRLHTVAVTEGRTDAGKTYRYLTLGAAVEFRPNAWYQAWCDEFTDGTVRVTELRAEFATDPRKEKVGKARVQRHVRWLTKRDGERTEYDGEFLPSESRGQYGPSVRVWGLVGPTSARNVWLELPTGAVPPRFFGAPPANLLGTTTEVPPQPARPGPRVELVQPPTTDR